MMKTPITVLQELMVKYGDTPEYECVAQSGPQHLALFEYRCSARGLAAAGAARSKREAKQEAARAMLRRLAAAGAPVPPPYAAPAAAAASASASDADSASVAGAAAAGVDPSRSYKALLKELCEEYHLPAPEYALEADTGPAHARRFTARGAVGAHQRRHTAATKKAAQQGAAHQLYKYLRENLARLTTDFVEEEALARAHERAMERYAAAREDAPWRPDLAQRVTDYHLGLLQHIDQEKLVLGAEALEGAAGRDDEAALEAAAAALGLRAEWLALPAGAPAAPAGALTLLRLAPASPPLLFAAASRRAAAAEALHYLRLSLLFRTDHADGDGDAGAGADDERTSARPTPPDHYVRDSVQEANGSIGTSSK